MTAWLKCSLVYLMVVIWYMQVSGRAVYGRSPAEIVGLNPAGGIDVCCECCVLSGRGLCDELIIHPEESYRLWVVVCDLETAWMIRTWLTGDCCAKRKKEKRKMCYVVVRSDLERMFCVKGQIFWDMTSCRSPHCYQPFGGASCHYLQCSASTIQICCSFFSLELWTGIPPLFSVTIPPTTPLPHLFQIMTSSVTKSTLRELYTLS